MSLSDTRKAAIEAYLGESGKSINDLESTFWADLLVHGIETAASNLLVRQRVPFIKAPDFWGGPSGAIEFSTTLDAVYSGCWVYYDTATLQHDYDEDTETYTDNVAGFYWTEMNSTTEGTVYSNMLSVDVDTSHEPPAEADKVLFINNIPGGDGVGGEYAVMAFSYDAGTFPVGSKISFNGFLSGSGTPTVNVYLNEALLAQYNADPSSSLVNIIASVYEEGGIRLEFPGVNASIVGNTPTDVAGEVWVTVDCPAAQHAVLTGFDFMVDNR